MQQLVLILHIMVAAAIVALVLIQKSSAGSGLGSAFGAGASGTLFGSQGSVSFLFKLTALLVAVFFTTSITLAKMSGGEVSAAKASSSNAQVLPKLPIADNVPLKLNNLKSSKGEKKPSKSEKNINKKKQVN